MTSRFYLVALGMLVAASACAPADDGESVGDRDLESVSANGLSFNGLSFNGLSFNGLSFNGSELVGIDAEGTERRGAGLVGAELQGLFSDGSALPMRVDGARAEGDVWFYQVSAPSDSGRWSPCGVDAAGAPVEAIALAGRWDTRKGVPGGGAWVDDSSSFTFACRGASIAKCVELGYEPWSSVGNVSLRDYHQACVRMLRADYCGDGSSWTVDGTLINVYDNLGIQHDSEKWKTEAEWTPAGARLVSKENQTRVKLHKHSAPNCFDQLVSKDAGNVSHFAAGALLFSEYKK